MQKALITGASGGIGKELAFVMAKAGHDLVLVARNKQALSDVKKEIETTYKVTVSIYAADLSIAGSAAKLYKQLAKEKIEILVNNAGVGLKGDFFNDDPERTTQMAQLNMISLMELSQLYGKDFLKKKSGRILNIGSVAAFLPGANQPVYYATKAFVRSLSRALAYRLKGTNVTVTALHPGPTKTHFFSSANAKDFKGGATARAVAQTGYKAMMAGKVEVTHGPSNQLVTNFLVRVIPYRLQAAMVSKATNV